LNIYIKTKNILSLLLVCIVILGTIPTVLCIESEIENPYKLTDGGCIESVQMHSSLELPGKVNYYTAQVSSHIQGILEKSEIPYEVYGAVGTEESRLFVYSKGRDDGRDYANSTVLYITEQFEKDNPAWDAIVAVNGDFFDIETKNTVSLGEPEGPMIQNGAIYKGYVSDVAGRGVVGVTKDGTALYYTAGQSYKDMGWGVPYNASDKYLDIEIFDSDNKKSIGKYESCFGAEYSDDEIYLSTVDSVERDLRNRTVYVVKCHIYRHSHVPGNGVEGGTLGNYVYGEIVEIRDGRTNDKAEDGYALISVPSGIKADNIKLGFIIECQQKLCKEWAEVTNAIGFKQQILAEGNILLKNCYGTHNQRGDYEQTLLWTADIYDYPHCWKNRTALGFKEDGTPILLVAARSSHEGAYKNLGASYYELGEQLKALGCVNGFLLDGGGSSTFVVRNSDGSFSNVFVGEGNGRAVGNAVILAVRDKSVALPEEETESEEDTLSETQETESENRTEEEAINGKIIAVIIAVFSVAVCAAVAVIVLNKHKSLKR